ncbi:MAG: hypothetical protein WCY89_05250 [Flavobacteriaceae bacterium]
MSYKKSFLDLLGKSDDKEYVGLGNPNSNILFIGKEAGAPADDYMFHGSVLSWKSGNNYGIRYEPSESKIKNLNHTWQKYQKLYNILFKDSVNLKEQQSKYEITFVEDIFTTELSNLPSPKTSEAKKNSNFKPKLERRRKSFFNSEFIQEFQIVIIFALDNQYIESYNGEVTELFTVSCTEPPIILDQGVKIWVNRGVTLSGKPKIVIHTRQLATRSALNIDSLLEKISELVNDFKLENKL